MIWVGKEEKRKWIPDGAFWGRQWQQHLQMDPLIEDEEGGGVRDSVVCLHQLVA